MPELVSAHYDARYYKWHAGIADFGAWANLTKFSIYVRPSDTVLDFGCGDGGMLANLNCAVRLGVEPSAVASAAARSHGIVVHAAISEVPDSSVDVVVSNNALEHCLQPFVELQGMHRVLKPGGRAVIVIPCESVGLAYRPDHDMNHHVYSWSPGCLGNLMGEAGFDVLESKAYWSIWPPRCHKLVARLLGRRGFDTACWLTSKLRRRVTQVRAVGVKKIR